MTCDRDALIVEAYALAARRLRQQWGRTLQGQAVPDALGEAVCKWLRLSYHRREWSASKHARYLAHWASDLLQDHRGRSYAVRKASRHVRLLLVIDVRRGIEWSTDDPDRGQEDHVIAWLDHDPEDMPDETLPSTWREAFDALLAAGWPRAAIARLCNVSEEAARQWARGRCEPSPARQLLIERAAMSLQRAAQQLDAKQRVDQQPDVAACPTRHVP